MKVRASLQGTANLPAASGAEMQRRPIALPAQDVVVAAGKALEVVWPVDVPADALSIAWEASAEEAGAKDAHEDDRSSSPPRCRCACCRRRSRSSTARSRCR